MTPYAQSISLPLWQIGLLFILTAGSTAMLTFPRTGPARLKKIFVLLSVLLIGACVIVGLIDLKLLDIAVGENNVIEWLTSAFLLAAACLLWVVVVRVHRRGRPSPIAITLAIGFTWAFLRELEYGGNIVGERFWYSRNLFKIKSFMSVSYFEQFRIRMDIPFDALTLYAIHICFSAVTVVGLSMLVWHLIRNRSIAAAELRDFRSALCGRLCILGIGIFIAAEAIGGTIHRIPSGFMFDGWTQTHSELFHSVFEETLECWGAMTILFSAIALWQVTRRRFFCKEQL